MDSVVPAGALTNAISESRTPDMTANARKLKDTASQFEALVISQLLKDAKTSWAGEEDRSAAHMMEFAQEQMASALAAAGGLGLASLVVSGLERAESPATRPPAGTNTP